MATKTWTSKTDWEEWDWDAAVDLDTTPGDVTIAAGSTATTGTSPAYEAADWAAGYWRWLKISGTVPAGSTYYVRFRVGATQVACEAADWSDYLNGVDASGDTYINLRQWILNNPTFDVGPWIMVELSLESD